MNRAAIISIAVLLVATSLVLLFRGSAPEVPLKDGPIVAFGDSLIAGAGASEGGDLVSRLSELVGEEIVNLGMSGDTTARALERVNSLVAYEPRVTIVLLGGNDFLQKAPRAETFANLRNIVQTIQATGSRVLILGVRDRVFIDEADSEYERIAEETGAAYVEDVLSGLFADSRYMFDAIHPNDAGYARIAERVYPVLRDLLR